MMPRTLSFGSVARRAHQQGQVRHRVADAVQRFRRPVVDGNLEDVRGESRAGWLFTKTSTVSFMTMLRFGRKKHKRRYCILERRVFRCFDAPPMDLDDTGAAAFEVSIDARTTLLVEAEGSKGVDMPTVTITHPDMGSKTISIYTHEPHELPLWVQAMEKCGASIGRRGGDDAGLAASAYEAQRDAAERGGRGGRQPRRSMSEGNMPVGPGLAALRQEYGGGAPPGPPGSPRGSPPVAVQRNT